MKLLQACFLTALLALSTPASATSQVPDKLILDGEQLSLATNPLASLIRTGRIKLPEPAEHWSSNWRGYVATWSIRDDRLLLTKIDVLLKPEHSKEDVDAVPVNVLPQLFNGEPEVFADWFSGTLIVPRGEIVNYVHMGYGSTYERYTVLHLAQGRLLSRQDLSATQYEALRRERFAACQKTTEYAKRLEEAREQLSPSGAEQFLYEFAVEEYMSVTP
ncbi:hypothetical protein [Cognatiluteimonas lumbrici]|uniref:hypothetical protein n=1 Tax=Cognatiluteimonas lumbrici TaxID=2559601 RepID=UPI00112E2E79|nr:hypothetical protein [Luteimonas lumbrici]